MRIMLGNTTTSIDHTIQSGTTFVELSIIDSPLNTVMNCFLAYTQFDSCSIVLFRDKRTTAQLAANISPAPITQTGISGVKKRKTAGIIVMIIINQSKKRATFLFFMYVGFYGKKVVL